MLFGKASIIEHNKFAIFLEKIDGKATILEHNKFVIFFGNTKNASS